MHVTCLLSLDASHVSRATYHRHRDGIDTFCKRFGSQNAPSEMRARAPGRDTFRMHGSTGNTIKTTPGLKIMNSDIL
eukprot:1126963-Prorocentrum_minimum.AAC.5